MMPPRSAQPEKSPKLSVQQNQRDDISFNLLRIKGLYMFRALLAHLQEALHNETWYIARVLCLLAATGVGVKLTNIMLYIAFGIIRGFM
jgi:hypothetical protein